MYIGNDSYGVYCEFGGRRGWSMVERDVGSSRTDYDGPLNEHGRDLIAKEFDLPGLKNVTPATIALMSPEALEKMRETVTEPA